MHLVLLVVFFAWAGRSLSRAFKLPSGSKLLLILAIVTAVVGIVLASCLPGSTGRRSPRQGGCAHTG